MKAFLIGAACMLVLLAFIFTIVMDVWIIKSYDKLEE